jgi:hypothetical protein
MQKTGAEDTNEGEACPPASDLERWQDSKQHEEKLR